MVGYSGVAIYTRNATCAPIRAEEGITGVLAAPKVAARFRDLPMDQQIGGYPRAGQISGLVEDSVLDSEGRCVILEFPAFVLLGVYSPANRDETRDDFRLGFLEALDARIRNLVAEGKQVVLAGDLNVVRSQLDSSNVAESIRKNGISMEQWISMPTRRLFNQLVFGDTCPRARDSSQEQPVLWDLTRYFHPTREGMNTCWDTKKNTRPANYGSRIDYILCSDGLKDWFSGSDIQEGLMGSDHCPVFADILEERESDNGREFFLDIVNPPGMFLKGQRQRQWSQQDLLGLSAKLIPEFDGRQNIRDMFNKKSSNRWSFASPGDSGHTSTDPSFTLAEANPAANAGVKIAGDAAGADLPTYRQSKAPISKRPSDSPDARAGSKRSKQASTPSKSNRSKGSSTQQTLKAFFQSQDPVRRPDSNTQSLVTSLDSRRSSRISTSKAPLESLRNATSAPSEIGAPVRQWPSESQEKVFDPIEAKESWSKLLGKRIVPRCEHDEPCISLVTKKQGINSGKPSFSLASFS